MKKTLFAFALLCSTATVFANDGTKPGAKKDHCTGAAAAKCEKGMAGTSMEGMPACCRAKMAAAKAAPTTTAATTKSVAKSL